MTKKRQPKGGIGTNQYRTRGMPVDRNHPKGTLQYYPVLWDNWEKRCEAASDPDTDPQILTALAQQPGIAIRQKVASNPNLPLNLLQQLAQDGQFQVRLNVVRNPNCSGAILEEASHEPNLQKTVSVASHSNTWPGTLDRLAQHQNWEIRLNIARNIHTPPATLLGLAADNRVDILKAVAENPSTTPPVLERLCDSWPHTVPEMVARADCPPEILIRVITEVGMDPTIRHEALRHPNTPDHIKTITILGR